MKMLDSLHRQLRPGDFVLIKDNRRKKSFPAEVVRLRNFDSICVRFPNGKERYFSSREGFDDIIGGARRVGSTYVPL